MSTVYGAQPKPTDGRRAWFTLCHDKVTGKEVTLYTEPTLNPPEVVVMMLHRAYHRGLDFTNAKIAEAVQGPTSVLKPIPPKWFMGGVIDAVKAEMRQKKISDDGIIVPDKFKQGRNLFRP
jgi:hypothetical protein